jgi:hypothetical protein
MLRPLSCELGLLDTHFRKKFPKKNLFLNFFCKISVRSDFPYKLIYLYIFAKIQEIRKKNFCELDFQNIVG